MRYWFRTSVRRSPGNKSKGAGVATMIVLLNLKEGVIPEDYERWILDS